MITGRSPLLLLSPRRHPSILVYAYAASYTRVAVCIKRCVVASGRDGRQEGWDGRIEREFTFVCLMSGALPLDTATGDSFLSVACLLINSETLIASPRARTKFSTQCVVHVCGTRYLRIFAPSVSPILGDVSARLTWPCNSMVNNDTENRIERFNRRLDRIVEKFLIWDSVILENFLYSNSSNRSKFIFFIVSWWKKDFSTILDKMK